MRILYSAVLCALFLIGAVDLTYAQTGSAELTYQDLLDGYIQNDLDVKRLETQLEKTRLERTKIKIQNNVQTVFSTGTANLTLRDGGYTFSASPEVAVSAAQFNNLRLNLSAPVTAESADGGTTVSAGVLSQTMGLGVTAGIDIVSSVKKERELALLNADRALEEAERSLALQYITAEQNFLQTLLSLYEYQGAVLSAESDYLDEKLDFEEIIASGYSKSSASYRAAELKANSAERTVEENRRAFQRELQTFALKCGLEITSLPEDVPEAELLDINDFSKDNFIRLENALWNSRINELTRAADSPFSLGVDGGYYYKDALSGASSESGSHNAYMSVSAEFLGADIVTELSVPINDPGNFSVSLSASWDINERRIKKIEDRTDVLDARLDQYDIEEAEEAFRSEYIERVQKREDLLWLKVEREEERALYSELEREMKEWFARGIISETEYRQAKTDFDNALLKEISAKIERLIYNTEIASLFIGD